MSSILSLTERGIFTFLFSKFLIYDRSKIDAHCLCAASRATLLSEFVNVVPPSSSNLKASCEYIFDIIMIPHISLSPPSFPGGVYYLFYSIPLRIPSVKLPVSVDKATAKT